jgi:hypothetical protein
MSDRLSRDFLVFFGLEDDQRANLTRIGKWLGARRHRLLKGRE